MTTEGVSAAMVPSRAAWRSLLVCAAHGAVDTAYLQVTRWLGLVMAQGCHHRHPPGTAAIWG